MDIKNSKFFSKIIFVAIGLFLSVLNISIFCGDITTDGAVPAPLVFLLILCILFSIIPAVLSFVMKKKGLKMALSIVSHLISSILVILYGPLSLIMEGSYPSWMAACGFIGVILVFLGIVLSILEYKDINLIKLFQRNAQNDGQKEDDFDGILARCSSKTIKNEEEGKEGDVMQYIHLEVRPKDFEKKVNALAAEGWKVVSQSESTWTIHKCCGLSNTVDSIINVTLGK